MLKIKGQIYELKTKKELENPSFQEILKQSYKNKPREYIQCGCGLPLYTVFLKASKTYYLRTKKGYASKHRFECVFRADGIDAAIREEDGKIELKTENILFKKVREKPKERVDRKTYNEYKISERKIKGANHFFFIMADISYAESFNKLNKNSDRLDGDIKSPDIRFFAKVLIKNILNTDISTGKKVEQALREKKAYLYIDVITELTPENELKYRYTTKEGKSFLVDKTLWYKGNKLARIYNNIIKPPYLLIKIASKKEVYRFFIIPIADEEFFIPVESQKERDYIRELLSEGAGLYKPMTTLTIKQVLKRELAKQFYSIGIPDIRPDVFIFEKGKIRIVEIVDRDVLEDDDVYRDRLYFKEGAYSKLPGVFLYERVLR